MCFQVCVCGLEVKESRRGPATGALSLSDVDEVISQDLKLASRAGATSISGGCGQVGSSS